jgi:hypothetical protein
VLLEQMQARIDLLPQPQFIDHQMDRADAPQFTALAFSAIS